MVVDKIVTNNSQLIKDKINKTNNKKSNQTKTNKANENEKVNQKQSVELSTDAKKLQETESILRFALQRLQTFDKVRNEKLSEVKKNISKNIYDTEKIKNEVSEEIVPPEENKKIAKIKNLKDSFVSSLKNMDETEKDINLEKIEEIRQKIANGFYDDPAILNKTVDNLLSSLS